MFASLYKGGFPNKKDGALVVTFKGLKRVFGTSEGVETEKIHSGAGAFAVRFRALSRMKYDM